MELKKRRVVCTHVSTNMIHICVSFSVCCCRCDDSRVFIFRSHNYSSLLTLTAERGKSNFPFFSVSISSPPSHRHLTAHNSATVLLLFSVSGFFGTGSIIVVDVVWRTFAARLSVFYVNDDYGFFTFVVIRSRNVWGRPKNKIKAPF